jgi:hypothetical protein
MEGNMGSRWSMSAVFVILSVMIFSPSAQAGYGYFGLGYQASSLGKNLEGLDVSPGPTLNFGYRLGSLVGLEVQADYSGVDILGNRSTPYYCLAIGPRLFFNTGLDALEAFASAGIARHRIENSNVGYSIDGSGPYLGAGFTLFLSDRIGIAFSGKLEDWTSKDTFGNKGDVRTTTYGVSVVYRSR